MNKQDCMCGCGEVIETGTTERAGRSIALGIYSCKSWTWPGGDQRYYHCSWEELDSSGEEPIVRKRGYASPEIEDIDKYVNRKLGLGLSLFSR